MLNVSILYSYEGICTYLSHTHLKASFLKFKIWTQHPGGRVCGVWVVNNLANNTNFLIMKSFIPKSDIHHQKEKIHIWKIYFFKDILNSVRVLEKYVHFCYSLSNISHICVVLECSSLFSLQIFHGFVNGHFPGLCLSSLVNLWC